MSADYQPDFDIDNRRGQVGERLIGTFLEAMGTATIEVKTDYNAHRTGNFYVETAQRPSAAEDGVYVASGINRTKAVWWTFAGPSENGFIAVKADIVRSLAVNAPEREQPIHGPKSNATKGRLVKVSDIVAAILAER